VSHLGDLLSALVDGELSGTELDRANAHLAACGLCQAEASSLRDLKQQLRALAGGCQADAITRRLLAMPDALAVPAAEGPVAGATGTDGTGTGRFGTGGAGTDGADTAGLLGGGAVAGRSVAGGPLAGGGVVARPLSPWAGTPRRRGTPAVRRGRAGGPGGSRHERRRGRYVLWGTVSLVVAGIGGAAFGIGGSSGGSQPRISPPVEVFDVEHALTSGDVPFPSPADSTSRGPAAAAKP
jgi:hypothetical protein